MKQSNDQYYLDPERVIKQLNKVIVQLTKLNKYDKDKKALLSQAGSVIMGIIAGMPLVHTPFKIWYEEDPFTISIAFCASKSGSEETVAYEVSLTGKSYTFTGKLYRDNELMFVVESQYDDHTRGGVTIYDFTYFQHLVEAALATMMTTYFVGRARLDYPNVHCVSEALLDEKQKLIDHLELERQQCAKQKKMS